MDKTKLNKTIYNNKILLIDLSISLIIGIIYKFKKI